MQRAVGGDIERIGLGDCDMYCNEHGNHEKLFPNSKATAFAVARLAKLGRQLIMSLGYIKGDVLLTGPVDNEGDITDIPDKIAAEHATSASIEIFG